MNIRRALLTIATLAALGSTPAMAVPALDDPNTVVTVMQFTARDPANKAELAKRMGAIRDYLRKQPGYIENALMENRNPDSKPQYVGVSRWKSYKDWENLWLKEDFQKMVRSVGEIAELNPGTFAPVKR
jgi:heme-degrading monooxygenase HmoA